MRCTVRAPSSKALRKRLASSFEMGGETTDEEGDGANTCQLPARKKSYTIYNPDWAKLSEFECVRPIQGGQIFNKFSNFLPHVFCVPSL